MSQNPPRPDADFEEQTDPVSRVRRLAYANDATASEQARPQHPKASSAFESLKNDYHSDEDSSWPQGEAEPNGTESSVWGPGAASRTESSPLGGRTGETADQRGEFSDDTDGLSVNEAYEAGYEGITLFAEATRHEAADAGTEIDGARIAAVSVRHPEQAQELSSAAAAGHPLLAEDTSTAPHWIGAEIARSTVLASPLLPDADLAHYGNFVQTQEFSPIHLPPPPKNRFYGTWSLALGAGALLSSLFTPWLFPLAIAAVIFGVLALAAKRRPYFAVWGIGLAVLSGIFSAIWYYWMFVIPNL